MSLRKFISGVSALAVAVTAFAAMAVTASAKNYDDVAVTPNAVQYRVTDKGSGVFETARNNLTDPDHPNGYYSALVADLSSLPHIADATKVTVEFDTFVIASGGSTYKLMYGVGDKKDRFINGANSSAGNYNKSGLITYFGSEAGDAYRVYGKSNDYKNNVANKTVHAKITLNRETDTYECILTVGGAKVSTSGLTAVDNLTVIEAFTWNEPVFDLTFKDITVSYTVPDVISSVESAAAYTTANSYDKDVVVGIINLEVSNGAINLNNAIYKGKKPTEVTGDNVTAFQGSAQIAVIINGATDTSVLNNVEFN